MPIGPAAPEICSRTDRQRDRCTDRRVDRDTPQPYRGGVILRICGIAIRSITLEQAQNHSNRGAEQMGHPRLSSSTFAASTRRAETLMAARHNAPVAGHDSPPSVKLRRSCLAQQLIARPACLHSPDLRCDPVIRLKL